MLIQLSIHSSDLRTLVYLLQRIETKDNRLANPLKNIIYLQRYPMCFYMLHIGAPICFVKTVKLQGVKRHLLICFNCVVLSEIDDYYVLQSRLGNQYLMDKKEFQVFLVKKSVSGNNSIFDDLNVNLESFKIYSNPNAWKRINQSSSPEVIARLSREFKENRERLKNEHEQKNKDLGSIIREKIMVKDIEKIEHILVNRSATNENKRCKAIKMLHFKQFNFTLLGELKHKGVSPKKKQSGTSLFNLIKIIGEKKIYREQLSNFIFENSTSPTN